MSIYEFERRFLDEHLYEILQKLGREFESAAFIEVFRDCYPQEYANALRRARTYRNLNTWVARWYLSGCSRVQKGGLSPKIHTTKNYNKSRNHLWIKNQ